MNAVSRCWKPRWLILGFLCVPRSRKAPSSRNSETQLMSHSSVTNSTFHSSFFTADLNLCLFLRYRGFYLNVCGMSATWLWSRLLSAGLTWITNLPASVSLSWERGAQTQCPRLFIVSDHVTSHEPLSIKTPCASTLTLEQRHWRQLWFRDKW